MNKKEILENLIHILKVNLKIGLVESDDLPGKDILGEIGLDSINFLEFSFQIEQKFDITFEDEDIDKRGPFKTLDSLTDKIQEKIGKNG